MIEFRALVSMTNGECGVDVWRLAAAQEPRTKARAKACPDCPLRIGGDWEAEFAALPVRDRASIGRRWTCHVSRRHCAGALRLAVTP